MAAEPTAATTTPAAATAQGAAAAALDGDGDDDMKTKRRLKKVVADEDAAAAAAAPAAGASAIASLSGKELDDRITAEIKAIIAASDIHKLTIKQVRKELEKPLGKDVVSANKKLIGTLMEEAVISVLNATGAGATGDVAAAASAANAEASATTDTATAASTAGGDDKTTADGGGDEPASESEDDAGADKGSDDDYQGSKKRKKSKKEKKEKKKRSGSGSDDDDDAGPRKRRKKGKDGGPEPPKKSKSAFIFFSNANRKSVKDENEGVSFGQIGKILGERWKILSEEDKKPFEAEAKLDKQRYEREKDQFEMDHPDYEAPTRKSRKADGEGSSSGGGGGESAPRSRKISVSKEPDENTSFYDHVLYKLKLQRRKPKEKHDDEDIKNAAAAFINRMDKAWDEDSALQASGQPGIKKMQLLPDVISTVSKVVLHEQLRNAGVLRAFGQWLMPLQDGSLPNLKLRSALYELLTKIKVDEMDLSNSQGLGKLVMRLWGSKHETLANKKILQALIEKWTRPIFGATTDYKKLAEVEKKKSREMITRKDTLGYKPLHPTPAIPKRAIIPEAATFDYAYRPESQIDEEELEDRMPAKLADDSMRSRLTKRIDPRSMVRSRSMSQSSTVDITGNKLN